MTSPLKQSLHTCTHSPAFVCAELHAKCHVEQPAKTLWYCTAILPDPESFLSLSCSRAQLLCCIYLGKEMRWKCNPADSFNSSSTPGMHHSPDWQPCPCLTHSFKVLLVYRPKVLTRTFLILAGDGWRRPSTWRPQINSSAESFPRLPPVRVVNLLRERQAFPGLSCRMFRQLHLPLLIILWQEYFLLLTLFPLSAETWGQKVCFIVKKSKKKRRQGPFSWFLCTWINVDFGHLVCDREDRNGKEMLLRGQ